MKILATMCAALALCFASGCANMPLLKTYGHKLAVQVLNQLKDDGRITQEEYDKVVNAMYAKEEEEKVRSGEAEE